MIKKYMVRGILRKDNKAKSFTKVVQASSIKVAEQTVREIVSNYCNQFYPDLEEVKCIINKKTVRCD